MPTNIKLNTIKQLSDIIYQRSRFISYCIEYKTVWLWCLRYATAFCYAVNILVYHTYFFFISNPNFFTNFSVCIAISRS